MVKPFGSNNSEVNINVPKMFGASIISFNVSADWSAQAGTLNLDLIEDDVNGDRFRVPIIGQPTGLKIYGVDNDLIFEFNGIVDSVARNIDPNNGKTYSVNIVSPLKILEAATIITDTYAGYGGSYEGIARYFSDDGYYEIDESPPNYLPSGASKVPSAHYYKSALFSFGTNNNVINAQGMWSNCYNILNVFGVFENDQIGIVPFKGFGASATSDAGMTLDRVCYALDVLINKTHHTSSSRYLGGNLLFGTSTYNICATAYGYIPPTPYYYGLDIIGFYNQVLPYLGADYRIKGPITIAEMISQICQEINADFMVDLYKVDYVSGDYTNYENTSYSVYSSGEFILSKTYPNSVLGGVIAIKLLPKNTFVNCNKPFSEISHSLIGLEKPGFGDYGNFPNIHPGIDTPVDSSFQQNNFSDATNPLDHDFSSVGTAGSHPYGGTFPHTKEISTVWSGIQDRIIYGNIGIKSNDNTTARMVLGGFQTRMVSIPRDYIYQYWGDITIFTKENNCNSLSRSSQKKIPIITQILPPNDIIDSILIDIQDIIPRTINFWDEKYWPGFSVAEWQEASASNINGLIVLPVYKGIYIASLAEIRAAMVDMDTWADFMERVKPLKYKALTKFLESYERVVEVEHDKNIQNFKGAVQKAIEFTNAKNNKKYKKRPALTKMLADSLSYDSLKVDRDEESTLEKLYKKIESIGSQHYGKSWYVPIPIPKTKVTINDDNLIGNYVRSWELTDSAYVEPYLFKKIGAPFDSTFINSGRLKAFANFEYTVKPDGSIGYDLFTDKVEGFPPSGLAKYDFSEYGNNNIVFDKTGCVPNTYAHVLINNMSENYEMIPCKYFTTYNRSMMQFVNIEGIMTTIQGQKFTQYEASVFAYNSPNITDIVLPHMSGCNTAILINSLFDHTDNVVSLDNTTVHISGYDGFYNQAPSQKWSGIINNLLNMNFDDNGKNSLPFVGFTTERVYYPFATSKYVSPNNDAYRLFNALGVQDFGNLVGENFKKSNLAAVSFNLFPPVAPPHSVCIPQKSNRYVYGPWLSNYNIVYAGKVEVEQIEDLVPENYIIPLYGNLSMQGGSYSGVINEQYSGFAGLNLVGQATANSIDNFSLFAQEEGTITLPGLPLIKRIGEHLLNGPRITDISVSVNSNGEVQTTYNFRQNTPRLGKINKEVIKYINKLSRATRMGY